jgi:hypothetical protein
VWRNIASSQLTALVEQIAAPVRCLDFILNNMRKGCLENLVVR